MTNGTWIKNTKTQNIGQLVCTYIHRSTGKLVAEVRPIGSGVSAHWKNWEAA